MNYCKNACELEKKFIRNILKDKKLVKIVKDDFTKLLLKMEKIGIKLDTILSPIPNNTGNIGTSKTTSHSNTTLIKHLLSDNATIREKSHSVTNAMWNPTVGKPNYENFKIIYKYIMKNRKKTNFKGFYKAIQVMTKHKNPEVLDPNNKFIASLWHPTGGGGTNCNTADRGMMAGITLFPGYLLRSRMIYSDRATAAKKNNPKHHILKKSDLIEPFSEFEKEFLSSHYDMNNNTLPFGTGSTYSPDSVICDLHPAVNKRKKRNCKVAAISGTAIELFVIGKIFEIDLKSMFIGLLAEMVPIHHSIEEICHGLHDFNYFLNCGNQKNVVNMELFNTHKAMLNFIKDNIVSELLNRETSPLKKRSPKKRSPKKRSPKKRSPKKRSPKKRSPKKRSPKKNSPREIIYVN